MVGLLGAGAGGSDARPERSRAPCDSADSGRDGGIAADAGVVALRLSTSARLSPTRRSNTSIDGDAEGSAGGSGTLARPRGTCGAALGGSGRSCATSIVVQAAIAMVDTREILPSRGLIIVVPSSKGLLSLYNR